MVRKNLPRATVATVALSILLTSAIVHSQETDDAAKAAGIMDEDLIQPLLMGINHLEPIPAYDPDGYDIAVYQSLIGKRYPELWMIGKPSFSPEYAVLLYETVDESREVKVSDDGPLSITTGPTIWILEYVKARKQIWKWNDEADEDGYIRLDIRVTDDLERKKIQVSEEFAIYMRAAWESVLEDTRYTKLQYRGCDGATFQFYCHHNLFGEIWTPAGGIPGMLTSLGHELITLASAEEKDRTEREKKCLTLATTIELVVERESVAREKGVPGPTFYDPESSESSEVENADPFKP
ncbi:MAG: hypothetical protein CMO55_10300 [Verrucomicrobiales bacterium]|nr:hypothetical protein [Verrucomicrobiales bacterium]